MRQAAYRTTVALAALALTVAALHLGCHGRSSLRPGGTSQTATGTTAGGTGGTGGTGGSGASSTGGGTASECAPQEVHDDSCVACTVGIFLGAFWNGRACVELRGCQCAGPDCDEIFASLSQCEAARQDCDGARCQATGGQWFPATAGFCGFACGGPLPFICEAPVDACLCPTGQTFQSGQGCVADPSCSNEQLCLATRGTWHPEQECYCGFTCGMPNECQACVDSCDCGPHRTFTGGQGCLPDSFCADAQPADICIATGGYWDDCSSGLCSCGHYSCGHPNTLEPCIAPGCDCGQLSNYDDTEGCVYDAGCTLGDVGRECSGLGYEWSSCRLGLSCCEHCGMPPGCPSCVTPCCTDDPMCEDNGCYPPPP